MDFTKFIARKQIAWQCFSQTKKTFCSATSARFNCRPTHPKVGISSNQLFLGDKLCSLNFKAPSNTSALFNSSLRLYSSATDSDKQDNQPEETPSPSPEEKSAKEAVKSLEESPRTETSAVASDSEDQVSSTEQEEPELDHEPKVDKLYKAIELEVLAYEPSVLDSYQWFVITAATHLGIKVGKCWSPPNPDKMRFEVLKSIFVHKKHQVQYEVRTHHRFLTFHKLTSSTADTFLEYIERNLPEGVGLKVTRVEAKPIPDFLKQSEPQSQHQEQARK